MPKKVRDRLSPTWVTKTQHVGKHLDGGGLYLQVTHNEKNNEYHKSWLFRYLRAGKDTWIGLGNKDDRTLAEARAKAKEYRNLITDGKDPLDEKRRDPSQSKTFAECRQLLLAAKSDEWKNAKHKAQWENTLKTYADPVIGDMAVDGIDTEDVLAVLTPIWSTKTETATRVRQRMESVLDYATTLKYRTGENPARWRGHLDNVLAKPTKVKSVQHHPALPYPEIGEFMDMVRANTSTAARALELLILTATRTSEVIGARWDEIDMGAATWTIPATRMKSARPHVIPLSDQAVALLESLPREGDYLFPGRTADKPFSNMAMLKLLKRLGREDLTVHGFRSTFRDWCSESTNYPRDVAEMALAHTIKDKAEAAYRRGNLLEKRRRMMADWARYCEQPCVTEVRRLRA